MSDLAEDLAWLRGEGKTRWADQQQERVYCDRMNRLADTIERLTKELEQHKTYLRIAQGESEMLAKLRGEHEAARAAVRGYFKAIDWVAGDSFDMCDECRSRLDHAQAVGRALTASWSSQQEGK